MILHSCIHSFIWNYCYIKQMLRLKYSTLFTSIYAVRLNWFKVLSINFVAKSDKKPILQNKLYWTRDKLMSNSRRSDESQKAKSAFIYAVTLQMVELQCVFLYTHLNGVNENDETTAQQKSGSFDHMCVSIIWSSCKLPNTHIYAGSAP